MSDDEHLAYGDYPGGDGAVEGGERGIVGNTFGRLGGNDGISSLLSKVHVFGNEVLERISGDSSSTKRSTAHRFGSFAGPQEGNDVKWHVDGCSYMWAVSVALEEARESVWILDCPSPTAAIIPWLIDL